GSLDNRSTQNFAMRARGYITADARNQTEYGTVRSYIAVGVSGNPDPANGASNTFSANRAFIQFAGFTFGITQSFYDFYSGPATSFFGGNINVSSDTGDAGKQVTAYTAQFGGGMSATISMEGQRNFGVINTSNTAFTAVGLPTSSQRGQQYPDIIANLRIDQAWGGAQIMGAIHDATGLYNGTTTATGQQGTATGWALGAGLKLLAPMIGAGDYFQGQFNYTVGAGGYTNGASAPMYAKYNGGAGGSYGFGIISDSVYSATTGVQLTTTWNVNAAYEHFWNKSWQTSVYGAYAKTEYNSTANTLMCASQTIVTGFTSCNMNFAVWNIGSRTQWNIDSQTAMGVDIVYQRINSAQFGGPTSVVASTTQPAAVRSISDQGTWMGQFRIHRNFYP
ncbi:MAG TPA: porin, partial [Pseudolabrys sp.]